MADFGNDGCLPGDGYAPPEALHTKACTGEDPAAGLQCVRVRAPQGSYSKADQLCGDLKASNGGLTARTPRARRTRWRKACLGASAIFRRGHWFVESPCPTAHRVDSKFYETSILVHTQAGCRKCGHRQQAAFDALDAPQSGGAKAAADDETAVGCQQAATPKRWKPSSNACVLPPSAALKADMKKVGDTMLKEWVDKAGPEGQAIVDAFRK